MKKIATILVAGAVMTSGCSKRADGSEFVGIWYNPGKGEKIQIMKNGESFLMRELATDKTPHPSDATLPAVYQDGLLKVMVGSRSLAITHVQDQDTIVLPLMNGQGTETLGRVKE